ncbi:hypothetical protein D9M68_891980 [compost metagenome]
MAVAEIPCKRQIVVCRYACGVASRYCLRGEAGVDEENARNISDITAAVSHGLAQLVGRLRV